MTIKIGSKQSQEFIVVIKAPKNQLNAKIVSFIDIVMADSFFANPTKQVNHKHSEVS